VAPYLFGLEMYNFLPGFAMILYGILFLNAETDRNIPYAVQRVQKSLFFFLTALSDRLHFPSDIFLIAS
jgi:hypothetical protein